MSSNSKLEKAIYFLLKNKDKALVDLNLIKRKIAKNFKIPLPSNVELLEEYHKLVKKKRLKRDLGLENILKKRRVRSVSGIVNISVLTKPYSCPGKCLYCPNQKGVPKSYLNDEPAVMRAILNNFHPYFQVQTRMSSLMKTGHPLDKIELRIVGGTWSFYPKKYQFWFVANCFRAANKFNFQKRVDRKIDKDYYSLLNFRFRDLEKEQKKNEKAKYRIVGLSIETRPDFINPEEIKRLRKLGVTMVEIGVQSIYDDVLKMNRRGHLVEATIQATKLLKDAGFKVLYQVMPNLMGSDIKKDIEMFKIIFSDSRFQPDLLKIYPCTILKEAPLYKFWQEKKYKPYSARQLINLLKDIKKEIPYYVRIQRVVRDIPAQNIVVGPGKISNLREIVIQEMKNEGLRCRCIRCREVRENYNPKEKIYFYRQDYDASEGKEIFLSFENKDRTKLYSILRLRIPSHLLNKKEKSLFSSLKDAAIIREVHTYGPTVPLGKKQKATQHRGLGKKLIKKAEEIVKKEFKIKKVAIISGVGVRDYYRKLGYRLKDTYMVKIIK